MLSVEIDDDTGVALFQPEGPLSEADFEAASRLVDAYIEEHGHLYGLIIRTREFPGWESFKGLVGHIRFVKNHHTVLSHVALVTDSKLGDLAEHIARHFVAAEVKHFPFDELASAADWILEE